MAVENKTSFENPSPKNTAIIPDSRVLGELEGVENLENGRNHEMFNLKATATNRNYEENGVKYTVYKDDGGNFIFKTNPITKKYYKEYVQVVKREKKSGVRHYGTNGIWNGSPKQPWQ